MGKDLKINHSFSSLPLGKLFFAKKLCIGEQTFWGKFIGGCFTLGLMIRSWQAKKEWDHFYGESWSLKAPCKDSNLAIVGGLGWMKWLKMGQGKVYISCNYSCTISFLVKILLVKLKYLYIQYAWISNMKKQNSIQNGMFRKMVLLVKTFDHYQTFSTVL